MIVKCDYCGKDVEKKICHVNRARKLGKKLFCNRTCFGLNKRHNRTDAESKEIKRLYDLEYRDKNESRLKIVRKEWFAKDYAKNPEKYRLRRIAKYKKHLEYLSAPEYKEWKKNYDKVFRAKKQYGEFWEAELILRDIENEIDNREVKLQLGLINKTQKRKRKYERLNSSKLEKCPLGNS